MNTLAGSHSDEPSLKYEEMQRSVWEINRLVIYSRLARRLTARGSCTNLCFIWSTLRRWDYSAAIPELFSFLGIGTKHQSVYLLVFKVNQDSLGQSGLGDVIYPQ